MAYSELIKSFAKIREYVSQFYVYGFKSRSEYTAKSARSYDNEKRRIESWLGDYMQFRQNKGGKSSFLALDSRTISHNPLYNAFKAKSFTENDINLHFYLLDILEAGEERSLKEIIDSISNEYVSTFDNANVLDESTIRKKLKEYEKLGIIKSKKQGKELFYSRNSDCVDLESWKYAAAYFSEEDPIGVVGSFILDKYERSPDFFTFKHHYILHALESEILEALFEAIRAHKKAKLSIYIPKRDNIREHTLLPIKIYCSTQSGRRYVLGYHYKLRKMAFFRLDNVKSVKLLEEDERFNAYSEILEKFKRNVWGVSIGQNRSLVHIEFTVFVDDDEKYIINRLEREKRCGRIEKADTHHYKFIADVYDAMEMMPWIRTFTGRITNLECSDKAVADTFYADFNEMVKMYGGDDNAF